MQQRRQGNRQLQPANQFDRLRARFRPKLTPERLHVGDGHPEYGQLVRFPGQGTARRHHVRQLGDVGRHLVPSPPLDLAMVLPTVVRKKSHRSSQRCHKPFEGGNLPVPDDTRDGSVV